MLRFFKVGNNKIWLLGCLVVTYSHIACANDSFQTSKHIDPLLGLDFSSTMTAEYGHNDNVFFQHKTDVVGSDYYNLKPTFSIQGQRNTKKFSISYQGDYRNYTKNMIANNNYVDHRINGIFDWELGFRHHLKIKTNYAIGHEALGTGVTNGFSFSNNDKLDDSATFNSFNIEKDLVTIDKNLSIKYTYGAKDAKGNLVFELTQNRLNYDILDSYTSSFQHYLKDENVKENDAILTFVHRYSNHTLFDYTLKYKKDDYIDLTRNNNELIAAFTIMSQMTGKSKIEATIYKLEKQMATTNFSGVNWSVLYKWQPVDYSTVTLKTLSEVKEPDNLGDFVQSYQNSITWDHQFLGHISVHLSYKHENDAYHIRKRKDKYDYLNLSVSYLFRPKVEFTLGYQYSLFHTDNSSDPVYINGNFYKRDLGYEQNQFGLSVKVAI